MTLDNMCISAARYSDRYDEFEKTEVDGEAVYEDDAEHYFNVFRDAINEAYMAVSREQAMPNTLVNAKVGKDGVIDLTAVYPMVYSVQDVLNETRTAIIPYVFRTKYELQLEGVQKGETVALKYHYLPERLEKLSDEPIFSEAVVDPMVYISLAVARIWQSEKKFDYADRWLQVYYAHLRAVKSSMSDRSKRRIPRRMFR